MRKLYAAVLIGAIAVFIDFLFHYLFLEPYQVVNGATLDYLESPAYFIAKFPIHIQALDEVPAARAVASGPRIHAHRAPDALGRGARRQLARDVLQQRNGWGRE